jgi:hypothetical protein
MPLLDNLLDIRLWPWVAGYLLCCIPVHRAALGRAGISLRGGLYCLALCSALVVVTYPAAFGLRTAPDLVSLLGETRLNAGWSAVWVACLLAMLTPQLRNRYTGQVLSLWTLSCCVLVFSALRDYLFMSRAPLVPGPSVVAVLLLSVWLAERLGRPHAAPGTATFSVLSLQTQALIVLVYAGFAGLQVSI